MARFVVKSPDCLLADLAAELAKVGQDQSSITVVMPTQRLGTYLVALLASELRAVVPPRIQTLDEFVGSNANLDKTPVVPAVQEAGLHGILRDRRLQYLPVGCERELLQFFNDLNDLDEPDRVFNTIFEVVARDVVHDEAFASGLRCRFEEVREVWQDLKNQLENSSHFPETALRRMAAEKFSANLSNCQSPPWRRLIICGLTTCRPFYGKLLEQLAERDDVEFWLSPDPQAGRDMSPVGELHRMCGLQSSAGSFAQPDIAVIEHDQPFSEVAWALNQIESLISGGVSPAHIGVLLANEGRYRNLVRTFFRRSEISVNLAIGMPIGETLFGRWVASFAEATLAPRSDWAPLTDLAAEPLSEMARNRDIAGWIDLLNLRGLLDAYHNHKELPFVAWFGELESHLDALGIGQVIASQGTALIESRGGRELFLELGQQLGAVIPEPMTLRRFWEIVRQRVLPSEVRAAGFPLRGVQVLSLAEARFIPFSYTFILGCNEGLFPRALPRDHIIDDWLKTQIGLKGWRYVEALEDTTFQLISATSPNLVLTYSTESLSGGVQTRSRFIERLLAADEASYQRVPASFFSDWLLETGDRDPESVIRAAEAQIGTGHFQGDRLGLLATASASSVEKLLHCPYKFLLSSLGVRGALSEQQQQVVEEGNWLHQTAQVFFTGNLGSENFAPPLLEEVAASGWFDYALKRFTSIMAKLEPETPRPDLFWHMASFGWPRLIGHLAKLWTAGDVVKLPPHKRLREIALGPDGLGSEWQTATGKVQFAGAIDSLDVFEAGALITDYKRKNLASAGEVAAGWAPQLIVYALAAGSSRNQVPAPPSLVGYWSLLAGKFEARGVTEEAEVHWRDLGLCHSRTQKLAPQIKRLELVWTERLRALQPDSGASFGPEGGKHCGKCSFQGACRFYDPRYNRDLLLATHHLDRAKL